MAIVYSKLQTVETNNAQKSFEYTINISNTAMPLLITRPKLNDYISRFIIIRVNERESDISVSTRRKHLVPLYSNRQEQNVRWVATDAMYNLYGNECRTNIAAS